jgi:hypothetical protein
MYVKVLGDGWARNWVHQGIVLYADQPYTEVEGG